MTDLIIVGGGASGIACALTAAKENPGLSITLLEGMDRVGKKILATGNGRCNLTNEYLSPENYHTNAPEAFASLLAEMPTQMALDFFGELGLDTAAEDMGRVYPYCRQAAMVLDVLLLALRRSKVNMECGCFVEEIKPKNGGFTLRCQSGRTFTARQVVLATGGKASPKLCSDGSGYPLAASLGHSCTPLNPCLVPLRCKCAALKGLKGIRTQTKATLLAGGTEVYSDLGEVQLTEYGLSGIPALQLSCRLALLGRKAKAEVQLDLLPHRSEEELLAEVYSRVSLWPEEPLETFLLGLINKKILYAILKSLGIEPLSRPAGSLSGPEIDKLCRTLKCWSFPVMGTLPWDSAQVTAGGIPLSEIVPDTMESRLQPGLYLTGELLDVAGNCGGYNLHWAWCSGIRAGRAIAHTL